MISRRAHFPVIMADGITGRDSTARTAPCAAPRPRGALWRKADLIRKRRLSLSLSLPLSLSRSRLLPPDDQEGNEESPRAGSAHGQAKHVASGAETPDRRPCG